MSLKNDIDGNAQLSKELWAGQLTSSERKALKRPVNLQLIILAFEIFVYIYVLAIVLRQSTGVFHLESTLSTIYVKNCYVHTSCSKAYDFNSYHAAVTYSNNTVFVDGSDSLRCDLALCIAPRWANQSLTISVERSVVALDALGEEILYPVYIRTRDSATSTNNKVLISSSYIPNLVVNISRGIVNLQNVKSDNATILVGFGPLILSQKFNESFDVQGFTEEGNYCLTQNATNYTAPSCSLEGPHCPLTVSFGGNTSLPKSYFYFRATSFYLNDFAIYEENVTANETRISGSGMEKSPRLDEHVLYLLNRTENWATTSTIDQYIQAVEVYTPGLGVLFMLGNSRITFEIGPELLSWFSAYALRPNYRRLTSALSHYRCLSRVGREFFLASTLTNALYREKEWYAQYSKSLFDQLTKEHFPLQDQYAVAEKIRSTVNDDSGFVTFVTPATEFTRLDDLLGNRWNYYLMEKNQYDEIVVRKLQKSAVTILILVLSATCSFIAILGLYVLMFTQRARILKSFMLREARDLSRHMVGYTTRCPYHYYFGVLTIFTWLSFRVVMYVMTQLQLQPFARFFRYYFKPVKDEDESNKTDPADKVKAELLRKTDRDQATLMYERWCVLRYVHGEIKREEQDAVLDNFLKTKRYFDKKYFVKGIRPKKRVRSNAQLLLQYSSLQTFFEITHDPNDEVPFDDIYFRVIKTEVGYSQEDVIRRLRNWKLNVIPKELEILGNIVMRGETPLNEEDMAKIVHDMEQSASSYPLYAWMEFRTTGPERFKRRLLLMVLTGILEGLFITFLTFFPFIFSYVIVLPLEIEHARYSTSPNILMEKEVAYAATDTTAPRPQNLISTCIFAALLVYSICMMFEPILVYLTCKRVGEWTLKRCYLPIYLPILIRVLFTFVAFVLLIAIWTFVLCYCFNVGIWWILGAIIAPNRMLVYASSVAAFFFVIYSSIVNLQALRDTAVKRLTEKILEAMLKMVRSSPAFSHLSNAKDRISSAVGISEYPSKLQSIKSSANSFTSGGGGFVPSEETVAGGGGVVAAGEVLDLISEDDKVAFNAALSISKTLGVPSAIIFLFVALVKRNQQQLRIGVKSVLQDIQIPATFHELCIQLVYRALHLPCSATELSHSMYRLVPQHEHRLMEYDECIVPLVQCVLQQSFEREVVVNSLARISVHEIHKCSKISRTLLFNSFKLGWHVSQEDVLNTIQSMIKVLEEVRPTLPKKPEPISAVAYCTLEALRLAAGESHELAAAVNELVHCLKLDSLPLRKALLPLLDSSNPSSSTNTVSRSASNKGGGGTVVTAAASGTYKKASGAGTASLGALSPIEFYKEIFAAGSTLDGEKAQKLINLESLVVNLGKEAAGLLRSVTSLSAIQLDTLRTIFSFLSLGSEDAIESLPSVFQDRTVDNILSGAVDVFRVLREQISCLQKNKSTEAVQGKISKILRNAENKDPTLWLDIWIADQWLALEEMFLLRSMDFFQDALPLCDLAKLSSAVKVPQGALSLLHQAIRSGLNTANLLFPAMPLLMLKFSKMSDDAMKKFKEAALEKSQKKEEGRGAEKEVTLQSEYGLLLSVIPQVLKALLKDLPLGNKEIEFDCLFVDHVLAQAGKSITEIVASNESYKEKMKNLEHMANAKAQNRWSRLVSVLNKTVDTEDEKEEDLEEELVNFREAIRNFITTPLFSDSKELLVSAGREVAGSLYKDEKLAPMHFEKFGEVLGLQSEIPNTISQLMELYALKQNDTVDLDSISMNTGIPFDLLAIFIAPQLLFYEEAELREFPAILHLLKGLRYDARLEGAIGELIVKAGVRRDQLPAAVARLVYFSTFKATVTNSFSTEKLAASSHLLADLTQEIVFDKENPNKATIQPEVLKDEFLSSLRRLGSDHDDTLIRAVHRQCAQENRLRRGTVLQTATTTKPSKIQQLMNEYCSISSPFSYELVEAYDSLEPLHRFLEYFESRRTKKCLSETEVNNTVKILFKLLKVRCPHLFRKVRQLVDAYHENAATSPSSADESSTQIEEFAKSPESLHFLRLLVKETRTKNEVLQKFTRRKHLKLLDKMPVQEIVREAFRLRSPFLLLHEDVPQSARQLYGVLAGIRLWYPKNIPEQLSALCTLAVRGKRTPHNILVTVASLFPMKHRRLITSFLELTAGAFPSPVNLPNAADCRTLSPYDIASTSPLEWAPQVTEALVAIADFLDVEIEEVQVIMALLRPPRLMYTPAVTESDSRAAGSSDTGTGVTKDAWTTTFTHFDGKPGSVQLNWLYVLSQVLQGDAFPLLELHSFRDKKYTTLITARLEKGTTARDLMPKLYKIKSEAVRDIEHEAKEARQNINDPLGEIIKRVEQLEKAVRFIASSEDGEEENKEQQRNGAPRVDRGNTPSERKTNGSSNNNNNEKEEEEEEYSDEDDFSEAEALVPVSSAELVGRGTSRESGGVRASCESFAKQIQEKFFNDSELPDDWEAKTLKIIISKLDDVGMLDKLVSMVPMLTGMIYLARLDFERAEEQFCPYIDPSKDLTDEEEAQRALASLLVLSARLVLEEGAVDDPEVFIAVLENMVALTHLKVIPICEEFLEAQQNQKDDKSNNTKPPEGHRRQMEQKLSDAKDAGGKLTLEVLEAIDEHVIPFAQQVLERLREGDRLPSSMSSARSERNEKSSLHCPAKRSHGIDSVTLMESGLGIAEPFISLHSGEMKDVKDLADWASSVYTYLCVSAGATCFMIEKGIKEELTEAVAERGHQAISSARKKLTIKEAIKSNPFLEGCRKMKDFDKGEIIDEIAKAKEKLEFIQAMTAVVNTPVEEVSGEKFSIRWAVEKLENYCDSALEPLASLSRIFTLDDTWRDSEEALHDRLTELEDENHLDAEGKKVMLSLWGECREEAGKLDLALEKIYYATLEDNHFPENIDLKKAKEMYEKHDVSSEDEQVIESLEKIQQKLQDLQKKFQDLHTAMTKYRPTKVPVDDEENKEEGKKKEESAEDEEIESFDLVDLPLLLRKTTASIALIRQASPGGVLAVVHLFDARWSLSQFHEDAVRVLDRVTAVDIDPLCNAVEVIVPLLLPTTGVTSPFTDAQKQSIVKLVRTSLEAMMQVVKTPSLQQVLDSSLNILEAAVVAAQEAESASLTTKEEDGDSDLEKAKQLCQLVKEESEKSEGGGTGIVMGLLRAATSSHREAVKAKVDLDRAMMSGSGTANTLQQHPAVSQRQASAASIVSGDNNANPTSASGQLVPATRLPLSEQDHRKFSLIIDLCQGDIEGLPELISAMGVGISEDSMQKLMKLLISLKTLRKLIQSKGDITQLSASDVVDILTQQIFNEFDVEKTGRISFPQFCNCLVRMQLRLSEQESRLLFNKADADSNGYITAPEFRQVLAMAKDRFLSRLLEKLSLSKELMYLALIWTAIVLAFLLAFVVLGVYGFSDGSVFTATITGIIPMMATASQVLRDPQRFKTILTKADEAVKKMFELLSEDQTAASASDTRRQRR